MQHNFHNRSTSASKPIQSNNNPNVGNSRDPDMPLPTATPPRPKERRQVSSFFEGATIFNAENCTFIKTNGDVHFNAYSGAPHSVRVDYGLNYNSRVSETPPRADPVPSSNETSSGTHRQGSSDFGYDDESQDESRSDSDAESEALSYVDTASSADNPIMSLSFFKNAKKVTITGGTFTTTEAGDGFRHTTETFVPKSGLRTGSGVPSGAAVSSEQLDRLAELGRSLRNLGGQNACIVSEDANGHTIIWVPTQDSFGNNTTN